MNIYRIEQDVNEGCETYDSAIVVASSEDAARRIHPASCVDFSVTWCDAAGVWIARYHDGTSLDYGDAASWVPTPEQVAVVLVGVAADCYAEGTVLCASYNGC